LAAVARVERDRSAGAAPDFAVLNPATGYGNKGIGRLQFLSGPCIGMTENR
jgi:hypothetical protein